MKKITQETVDAATVFYAAVNIANEYLEELIGTGIIKYQDKHKAMKYLGFYTPIEKGIFDVFRDTMTDDEEMQFYSVVKKLEEYIGEVSKLSIYHISILTEVAQELKELEVGEGESISVKVETVTPEKQI